MMTKIEEAIKDFAIKHQNEMEKVIIAELKNKFFYMKDGMVKWNSRVRLRLQERNDWEDKVREAIVKLRGLPGEHYRDGKKLDLLYVEDLLQILDLK